MSNQKVNLAVRVVMNGDVNGAVYGAAGWAVYGDVNGAVDNDVRWAVRGAVLQSLNVHSHPALADFLLEVPPGAGVA
jgi:hypothetical protein